jgi:hypothetical protein
LSAKYGTAAAPPPPQCAWISWSGRIPKSAAMRRISSGDLKVLSAL